MRVAAIDCGTNSIRLLIAEPDPDTGRLRSLVRLMRIVRLGQGVDQTGRFDPDAIVRTLEAVSDYAALIAEHAADSVRMVATSATRDAANAGVFIDGVRQRLGTDPEVISGEEEAALSFAGARSAITDAGPVMVVDIGGGSTEFVVGEAAVERSCSVNIGCVRMTERHLHSDPPTAAQIEAATGDIDAALAEADAAVRFGSARVMVGLAGTVTTIAAIDLGLTEYDSEAIHGHVLTRAAVSRIAQELLTADRARRAAEPAMHPGRVDVIGGGALILDRIVARGGFASVVVSEHDILDGIALSQLPPGQ